MFLFAHHVRIGAQESALCVAQMTADPRPDQCS
jgi:hypothetical protein